MDHMEHASDEYPRDEPGDEAWAGEDETGMPVTIQHRKMATRMRLAARSAGADNAIAQLPTWLLGHMGCAAADYDPEVFG